MVEQRKTPPCRDYQILDLRVPPTPPPPIDGDGRGQNRGVKMRGALLLG